MLSHLDFAHLAWRAHLKPGETAVDATCGNGCDTQVLAELVLEPEKGRLFVLDLQREAIELTKKRLQEALPKELYRRISFFRQSHEKFPEELEESSVSLIVYNLGYLPGGDKQLTTETRSTLKSLEKALLLIRPGGLVSVTCYPGHAEGKKEEEALVSWAESLSPRKWRASLFQRLNRKGAPSVLLLQRSGYFQAPTSSKGV